MKSFLKYDNDMVTYSTVNIMAADYLAMQWARASATMIYTLLNHINSALPHSGLK